MQKERHGCLRIALHVRHGAPLRATLLLGAASMLALAGAALRIAVHFCVARAARACSCCP